MPLTLKTTLVWSEGFILPLDGAKNYAVLVFNGNNLRNPVNKADPQGTHQPLGYDQLKVIWDHWVVIGVRAIISNISNNGGDPVMMGMSLLDAAATLGSDSNPCPYLELDNTQSVAVAERDAGGPGTIVMNYNPNKFLGIAHPLGNSLVRGEDSDHSVSENVYLHVWGDWNNGVSPVAQSLKGIIRLEYTVIWTEPKSLGQS